MCKKMLILLFCLISTQIFSEQKYLSLGYYGELLSHPGVISTLELPLYDNQKSNLFWTVRAGGYNHYLSYSALFVGSEIGYRYTWKSGFNLHTLVGLNYMHKFLDSPVYEFSEDGILTEVSDVGSSHFMPSVGFGMGYTLLKGTDNPMTIFSRTEFFGEYPYNTYILPHVTTCFGVRLQLD